MGLVGIFIPLYIYELTNDLGMIFLFYMIVHALVMASAVVAGALVARMGIDKSSVIASLMRAAFLGLLILGKENLVFLWVGAIVWGLMIPLCWQAYHYTVVGVEDGDGKFGKEVGEIKMVDRVAAAAGPFFGGVIIFRWGFFALYSVALVLAVLSAVPLVFDNYSRRGMRFSTKRISISLGSRKNWPIFLSWLGQGVETMIYGVAWWVFVYFAVKNYEVVGAISSGVLFLTLIICFWAGKWIDKRGPGVLKWGVMANSINWLIRPFLKTTSLIFTSDFLYRLVTVFIWTPIDAVTYEMAGKKRRLEFLVKREIWIHLGGLLTCFLVWIFLFVRFSWGAIFILGALGLVLSGLILEYRKKFEMRRV